MAAKTRRAGRSASGIDVTRGIAFRSLWLPVASAACFLLALMSAESIHYRCFWPELLAVVSLALLMGAVMAQVAAASGR